MVTSLNYNSYWINEEVKTMERRNLSVTLLSLFFVLLLTVPALAIKTARESKLNGGWQIWISAADFDKNEVVQPGVKEKKIGR